MKKTFMAALIGTFALVSCGNHKNAETQTADTAAALDSIIKKGVMTVDTLNGFNLHVYQTNDPMADASFIIEGNDSLVLMELPLFKDNAEEFEAYVAALKKPVAKIITDYHLGGLEGHKTTMPAGMAEFISGPVYSGMMQNFAQTFGDAIVPLPHNEVEEMAFDVPEKFAGVEFEMRKGATSDFPGASIIIGKQVYFTHWAPSKAHISNLQVSSAGAIDAEIAEAKNELASGTTVFIGGHGGQTDKEAVEFKIAYLEKAKELLAANKTPDDFVSAMKEVYPGLPMEQNLQPLADALYSK